MVAEKAKRPRDRFERKPKPWTEEQSVFWYRVGEILFGLLFRYWIRRFRVIGMENVPASGSQFLLCNHTTAMDPFILGYAIKHRRVNGPGKVEIFKNPVISYFMRKIGIFPLRQGGTDAAAVRTMISLYRAGRLVAVFPEGGRSQTGELKEFIPGLARLLVKLRAPIIPAGIAGGRELLPIGHLIPRPNTPVVLAIGEQFELSEFYGRELTPDVVDEANAVVRRQVEEQLAAAREERARLLARLKR